MLTTILETIGYDIGPKGPWVIVLLTVVLAGAAAWRTGQAVAQSWSPSWPVAVYALLLSAAVQFLHYALFQGPLLSVPTLCSIGRFLAAVALASNRVSRARMMSDNYAFAFEGAGPFGWRRKTALDGQPLRASFA